MGDGGSVKGEGPVEGGVIEAVAWQHVDHIRIADRLRIRVRERICDANPPLVQLIVGLAFTVDLYDRGQGNLLKLDACEVGELHRSLIRAFLQGGGIILCPHDHIVGVHAVLRGR